MTKEKGVPTREYVADVITQEATVGQMVDEYFELSESKSMHAEEVKRIDAEMKVLKASIIVAMNSANVDKLTAENGTVSLNKGVAHPTVKDKSEFMEFMSNLNDYSMAVVTVNKAAFKEYYEENGEYPSGVDAYFEDALNARRKSR